MVPATGLCWGSQGPGDFRQFVPLCFGACIGMHDRAMHRQCCLVGEGVVVWMVVDEGVMASSVPKLVPCNRIAPSARTCGVAGGCRMQSVGSVGVPPAAAAVLSTGNTVELWGVALAKHPAESEAWLVVSK
jgi:hypothetical protein